MWRIGVLALVLSAVCADTSFPADKSLFRLKRTPHYHCDPEPYYGYHPPRPHFWPPPPDQPRYWPPPPPQHHYGGYSGSYHSGGSEHEAIKEEPVPEPAPEPSAIAPQGQSEGQSQGQSEGQSQCKNCNGGAAVSNAQSDHGDAIAVAIARSGSG